MIRSLFISVVNARTNLMSRATVMESVPKGDAMKEKAIGVVLKDLKRGDTLWGMVTNEGKLECPEIQFLIEARDLIIHKPSPDGGLLMPFGKYKGESLADIPDDYYNWLLDQDWFAGPKWTQLRLNIEKELEARSELPKPQERDQFFPYDDGSNLPF